MKKLHYKILTVYFLSTMIYSCNSKKNIDLKLPEYDPQYVLECYLVPGQKYKLLLTQSTGIESSIPVNPFVFANVRIIHNNDTIVLDELPIIDTVYAKAYNYVSNEIVEYDSINPYFLEVQISNSDKILRAQTSFLPKPKINPIATATTNGNDFSLNVSIDDVDPQNTNYYLFQILDSASSYEFNSRPRNRAYFDDNLITTRTIGIYTSFKYSMGEKIIAKAYNLTKDHYDFISSVDEAQNANGNPFGRPTFIESNVSNAIGIFTSLNYDEIKMTVGK